MKQQQQKAYQPRTTCRPFTSQAFVTLVTCRIIRLEFRDKNGLRIYALC